uniref:Uncharacterized protein n=1 Tax=Nelumbo nucifera TaxID=4432 RepID=A0A822ZSR4_NELNU|nr:TPA_asm: hypothetical protein HUJ06_018219 [Nelumbo nucifera]
MRANQVKKKQTIIYRIYLPFAKESNLELLVLYCYCGNCCVHCREKYQQSNFVNLK